MNPWSDKRHRSAILTAGAISCLLWLGLAPWATGASEPRNVILFIGDGMGSAQVKAAAYYRGAPLCFESFSNRAEITTLSAGGHITDSAAASTALATGKKVYNGVVSLAEPGNGRELRTMLELFRDRGKRTGLVTTSYMTDATPAAFAAHESRRGNLAAIAQDYFSHSRPNVILGGGGNGMTLAAATNAGYLAVSNRAELLALATQTVARVSGQFGFGVFPYEVDGLGELPHLSEMTAVALEILSGGPEGFFLMVEGGKIDLACHVWDVERAIGETVEFGNSVQQALDWAGARDDTLIVVTADHETGGLLVETNNGAGILPTVSWTSPGHTATPVPLYAWGRHAALLSEVGDNTEVFSRVMFGVGQFADMDTDFGDIWIELHYALAPRTAANFAGLAEGARPWVDFNGGNVRQAPFYDGLLVDRVAAGLEIEAGSGGGTNSNGPGYVFMDEFSPELRHDRAGVVSMAGSAPNRNGSLFTITLAPASALDGVRPVFGQVVEGLDVAAAIAAVPTDAGGRPQQDLPIRRIAIHRNGAEARGFNPFLAAPRLPDVRRVGVRIVREGEGSILQWQTNANCRYWALATTRSLGERAWFAMSASPLAAGVLDASAVENGSDSGFFRVSEVEYFASGDQP